MEQETDLFGNIIESRISKKTEYSKGMNKGYLTASRDAESDEYLTSRYAVLPIVKYLKIKKYHNILCPFDKQDSRYVRVLQSNGFNIKYSHIETKNFFTYTMQGIKDIDCIVSNPPYSIKTQVVKRLYELGKPFMMLLPQNCLQSKERTHYFIKYGLEYLGFDSRICFYTNNDLTKIRVGNHFASGYFCWKVLPEKLMFEYLKFIQEPYI